MANFREFVALVRTGPEEMREKVNELLRGKVNTVAEITLSANQTTTPVTDELVSPSSAISLTPMTANAAAERPWVSSQGEGAYTLTHADNAQTDRTFRVTVTG